VLALVLSFAASWAIWVSVSLFNQRQEIAILKKILHYVEDAIKGKRHRTDP
jgi:hypothetical protein